LSLSFVFAMSAKLGRVALWSALSLWERTH
jgi:hypothetical protein